MKSEFSIKFKADFLIELKFVKELNLSSDANFSLHNNITLQNFIFTGVPFTFTKKNRIKTFFTRQEHQLC